MKRSMKNLCFIVTFLVIVLCCKVFAEVVTSRKSGQTQTQTTNQKQTQTTKNTTETKLSNSIKSCTPYNENLNTNVSGINFIFNVKILGWVNNKCRLDFNAQSNGINEAFSSIYGFDASDATILTFEPKIRCEFTKQQLNYVGDSILQEQERKAGAIFQ
jgi:hypothetical protein